jgi:hypothetical protein
MSRRPVHQPRTPPRRYRGLILILALLAAFGLVAWFAFTGPHGPAPPATTLPPPVTTPACQPPADYLAKSLPSPCLTPGQVRTDDPAVLCVAGYASKARAELSSSRWAKRRAAVLRAYGTPFSVGEIDHLLPLSGGGGNGTDTAPALNLWPQQDYKGKDRAEAALHTAICKPGVTREQVRGLQAAFLAKWRDGR